MIALLSVDSGVWLAALLLAVAVGLIVRSAVQEYALHDDEEVRPYDHERDGI